MTATVVTETLKAAARRLAAPALREGFKPAAVHAYTSGDGEPIYWRLRLRHPGDAKHSAGEKWIRPMHRNGAGYVLGEPPAISAGRKPIYRLHEIVTADRETPVFYVEGEPCADALAVLGIVATTAGSASSDERADFAPLAGRRVILWPDNDAPGREHMRRVAAKLHAIGCTVEAIEIDRLGLPAHGDVVDYLGAHPNATAADLMSLARIVEGKEMAQAALDGVHLIRGDTVRIEAIRWLWPGWLARGKLHIIAGAPGVGKTTVALALAATITMGGRWPDGSKASVGSVLIWSGEDDPADTLAPRLKAMGADMSRVFFVDSVADGEGRRAFDPAKDIPDLLRSATSVPDLRLVLLDPIVNAVGGDSHKSTEVRRALAPIVELASALDCAVLGVSHFSKGTAGCDPVERVTGSLAFGALARVVLAAAKSKEDGGTKPRILARAKSNIGPDGGGFNYSLEQASVPGYQDLLASRVTWGSAIQGTARELLAEAEALPDDDGDSPADVEAFIRGCLADGPVTAKSIREDANGAGHSWDKVKRTSRRIGVEKRKDGMGGGWVWALPSAEGSKGGRQKCLPPSHSSQPSAPPWRAEDGDAEAV